MQRNFFHALQLLSLIALLLSATGARASPVTLPEAMLPAAPGSITLGNPILFVTQVPIPADFTTIGSVFGNHRASLASVGRGGDLWIRYPDGTLKNLTLSAGYGPSGQGANAIAVRDPSVYWDGTKAVFSMALGAPTQAGTAPTYHFQLYEVTNLGLNQTPLISKVPNQPGSYNNIAPTYGSDDRIIFASDRPRNGAANLYPQLDEYEEQPTVTGLWSLDPTSGDLFMLDHTPSGAFTPILDSFGRVVFTRWDHLQRDQQADTDALAGGTCNYCTFNYSSEAITSTRLLTNTEVFPEPRGARTDLLAGTNMLGNVFNQFFPWQIHEDGSEEETLNHVGRQELVGYIERSFNDDNNLYDFYNPAERVNQNAIGNFLQIKEDPRQPGVYYGIDAPEFATHASGQVISMTAPPTLTAGLMTIHYVTHRETESYTSNPTPNHSGHYRDPLPLADGNLIAAHTLQTNSETSPGTASNPQSNYDFRLKTLKLSGNGYWVSDQPLTGGISQTVSYWNSYQAVTYSGYLWELNPVEVRARARPTRLLPALLDPEQQVLNQQAVSLMQLQLYLQQNNLALVVSRNVTTRDRADHQQPFNLRVAGGGAQTIGAGGKIYDVAYLQFFQADQLRGLTFAPNNPPAPGRRVIAQIMHDPAVNNPPNSSGPAGSVVIASDGSQAAFVPARRALSWQLTDAAGIPVVRERYWLTFQPGEIRLCTSCHGLTPRDQSNQLAPTNQPEALRQLLSYWKTIANPGPLQNLFLPLIRK